MLNQVALLSDTNNISFSDLTLASAAIQKQVTRDLGPIWNIEASVDAFESLDVVPLGYWQVIIKDQIPYRAAGIHLNNENGQPFALVKYSDDWTVTSSHEILEMLVDPSGNRTVATNSPKDDQGRVLILVEVCDPSEAAQFGYTVNGVLVSDFYTPHFFDPISAVGVRYSYTGSLTEPRQVLDGGYISWWDPESKHVFQLFVENGQKQFIDRGSLPPGFGTLRSFADQFTNERRVAHMKAQPSGVLLTGAFGDKKTKVDSSTRATAESLRRQIDALMRTYE